MRCLGKKFWFSNLFNMYIVCVFLPFVVNNKDEYKIFRMGAWLVSRNPQIFGVLGAKCY